ncbi:MAG: Crp/Fnr family transcriptional regulator [Desulfobulbaceae bacterium]|nr:Crp/Fnr family transcriptional regulator [Desulfobulbaceae bacterium]
MKTRFSKTNLLHELRKPENSFILEQFKDRHFAKNALIFGPGHEENLVFIVKQGKVRIYLSYEDKEFSLAFLGPGDLYSTHTRTFQTALEDTVLLVMPVSRFHTLMTTHHVFFQTILGTLGELLKQSFSIIESLIFKDVTQRIVEFLLYELNHHGRKGENGITLELDLTTEQLASVVGASRQTVSTIVNDLIRSGVVNKINRKTYLVPNPDILKEFPHC